MLTRTAFMTCIAMIAFAANSLFCRLALGGELIDAASFTVVRVLSGAVILMILILSGAKPRQRFEFNWRAALMLSSYMVFFSFAYLSLGAGTGALILFGAVQLTMLVSAMRQGERFNTLAWAGLTLAVIGLVYLVAPGVKAPNSVGAGLMVVAGVSWGLYSLWGRTAADPLSATAGNFLIALPMTLLACLPYYAAGDFVGTTRGLLLAIASGAGASALGYAVWYIALRDLTTARAAIVQLSVPVIAAIGGVLLLSEDVTLRLVLSSAATLGGVWIVLAQRAKS